VPPTKITGSDGPMIAVKGVAYLNNAQPPNILVKPMWWKNQ